MIPDQVLIAAALGFALIVLLSVSRAYFIGWQPIFTVQVALFILVIGVATFQRHLRPQIKVAVLVGSTLIMGITGTALFGIRTGTPSYFLLSTTLVTYFVSPRVGVGILAGVLLAQGTVLLAQQLGILSPIPIPIPTTGGLPYINILVSVSHLATCGVIFIVAAHFARNELRAAYERLRVILDGSAVPLIVYGEDKRIMHLNHAFTQTFGYQPEDIPTMDDLGALVFPDAAKREAFNSERNRLSAEAHHRGEKSYASEVTVNCKDGAVRQVLDIASTHAKPITGEVILSFVDLTEQKAAQRQIEQNEKRLRALLDASAVPLIVFDANTKITHINQAFRETIGYGPDDVVTVEDLAALLFPDATMRDAFRSERLRLIEEAHRTGKLTYASEAIIRCKDGTIRQVLDIGSMHAAAITGEVILSFIDVTEIKLAEQRLRSSEERLRGLFELSPLGIALFGPSGNFLEVNKSFQKIVGYSEAELKTLRYQDITPPEYLEQDRHKINLALADGTGPRKPYEKEYIRKDGNRVPIRLNGAVMTSAGGLPEMWAAVEDVSQERKTRREITQLIEDLERTEEMANVGGFRANLRTGYVRWSRNMYRMYEIDEGTPISFERAGSLFVNPADAEHHRKLVVEGQATARPWKIRAHRKSATGKTFWVESYVKCIVEKGAVVEIVGLEQNIDERVASETRINQLIADLERTEEMAGVGGFESDSESTKVRWTKNMYRLYDVEPGIELALKDIAKFYLPGEDVEQIRRVRREEIIAKGSCRVEQQRRSATGRLFWVETHLRPVRKDGKVVGIAGQDQDITEHKIAEQQIAELVEDLEMTEELAGVGGFRSDALRDTFRWTKNLRRIYEVNEATPISMELIDSLQVSDQYRKKLALAVAESGRLRRPWRIEIPRKTAKGREIWTENYGRPVIENNQVVGFVGAVRDITEQQEAAVALRSAKRQLDDAQKLARVGSWSYDHSTGRRTLSDELYRIYGLDPAAGVPTLEMLLERVHPDDRPVVQTQTEKSVTAAKPFPATTPEDLEVIEYRLQMPDGRVKWATSHSIVEYAPDGAPTLTHGVVQDITDRKEAATALAHSRQQLDQANKRYIDLFEYAPDGLVLTDLEGKILLVNKQTERIFGWTRDELTGQPIEILIPRGSRQNHVGLRAGFTRSASRREMAAGLRTLRGLRKDGTEFPVEIDLAPVTSDSGVSIAAVVRDVTQQREMEAQLATATRIDAIGKLTGGMAHDFNNYLGVIIGNLDLLSDVASSNERTRTLIDRALNGAQRAGELTRSLLAFARRQPLEPQIVQLNTRLAETIKLMRRTLGEQITIRENLAPGLWAVLADIAQLESAIVNLATNARDAMPNGGTLTIATRNVKLDGMPSESNSGLIYGDFVLIEVTDTGEGMTPEVLMHVFEPFFTTKPVGSGTGLGLSSVYGFVKQSGGHIRMESEPGHGTKVRIYLPSQGGQTIERRESGPQSRSGGKETILIVEDQEDLRQTAALQLEMLGYHVIEAASGEAALEIILQPQIHVDLLFTDVVMPGMLNGEQLAEQAKRIRPNLKVLLTSGFPAERRDKHGLQGVSLNLLKKPYRLNDLDHALRKELSR